VCLKITDGTHKTPQYVEKGVPFISTVNLVPYASDFNFSKYQKFINEKEHKELIKRAKPEKDDLLMAKCGTVGRTQMVKVDYEFSIFVGLMLIKPDKSKVYPKYLEYYLNQHIITKLLESLSTGATRLTLPINVLKEFEINLPFINNQPDLKKQKRIVDKIDELLTDITMGEDKLKEILSDFDTLRQSVLNQSFKGKL